MPKTNGPVITVSGSCLECVHERSERYRVQGDSGRNVSCALANRYIGDSTWNTPDWCPMLRVKLGRTVPEPAPEGGA